MARKLDSEVPSAPPAISIQDRAAWVNQIKFFLISTLQLHATAYLCSEAFLPPDGATRAIYNNQEMLALCLDELFRAHEASLLAVCLATKMWPRPPARHFLLMVFCEQGQEVPARRQGLL